MIDEISCNYENMHMKILLKGFNAKELDEVYYTEI